MENYVTRNGTQVATGQIWRFLRKGHEDRHVLVLNLAGVRYGLLRAVVKVCACQPDGWTFQRPAVATGTLSVDRMHRHSNGWELVGQVPVTVS